MIPCPGISEVFFFWGMFFFGKQRHDPQQKSHLDIFQQNFGGTLHIMPHKKYIYKIVDF